MNDRKTACDSSEDLKCPECSRPLKRRRSRKADKCEMICGGCGRTFDVCDGQTLDALSGS